MKCKKLILSGVTALIVVAGCMVTIRTVQGISPAVQLSSMAAVITGADNRGTFKTNEVKKASLGEHVDAFYSYSPNVSTDYAVSAGDAEVTVQDASTGEEIAVNEHGNYSLDAGDRYIIIAQGQGDRGDTDVSVVKKTAPVLEGVDHEISLDSEGQLSLDTEEEVSDLEFASSNEGVLTVDEQGDLQAVGTGVSVLSVTGEDSDQIPFKAEMEVAVTAPDIPTDTELVVAKQDNQGNQDDQEGQGEQEGTQADTVDPAADMQEDGDDYLTFGGSDSFPVSNLAEGSEISVETSDESLKAEVIYDGGTSADIRLMAQQEGNFDVHVTINGRQYLSSVSITSGTLIPVMTDLETGEEITFSDDVQNMYKAYDANLITTDSVIALDAEGFTDMDQIEWYTDDEGVASFDEEGRLHINGAGDVKVTASYNGAFATCRFTCVQKQVIGALEYVKSKYGSTYSQENRMGAASFDCSSLVWRAYASQGVYIGGWTSWAPVASVEASYLVGQKCLTFEAGSPTSQLRPGDLVFWTGRNAGEYLGIYHVDMYMGNGLCMTVRTSQYLGSVLPSNCFVVRPMATAQDDAASLKAENSYYQDPEDTGEETEETPGEETVEETGTEADAEETSGDEERKEDAAASEETGTDKNGENGSTSEKTSDNNKNTGHTSSGDDLSSEPEEEAGSGTVQEPDSENIAQDENGTGENSSSTSENGNGEETAPQ